MLIAHPPEVEASAAGSGEFLLTARVQDLSRNGTYVNGVRVGRGNSAALHDGDVISLVVVPVEQPDGSYAVEQNGRRSDGSDDDCWGQLEFGDGSVNKLTLPAGERFYIGTVRTVNANSERGF